MTDIAPATDEQIMKYEIERLRRVIGKMRDDIREIFYPKGWGYGKDWNEMVARAKALIAQHEADAAKLAAVRALVDQLAAEADTSEAELYDVINFYVRELRRALAAPEPPVQGKE